MIWLAFANGPCHCIGLTCSVSTGIVSIPNTDYNLRGLVPTRIQFSFNLVNVVVPTVFICMHMILYKNSFLIYINLVSNWAPSQYKDRLIYVW